MFWDHVYRNRLMQEFEDIETEPKHAVVSPPRLVKQSDYNMVERNVPTLSRLYLEKNVIDIFLDAPHLPMHQYDGIRFMYRQYKKSKAGVILNDPPGYGKRAQTVLFIGAMRPVVTLPILILCNEGKEQSWLTLFKNWTNMAADVTVQKWDEIIRPVCVIGFPSYLYMLSRREWSILVVDDIILTKEILHSGLKAKYKIWITSCDMKKNLQTFSLIYKWFYPTEDRGRLVSNLEVSQFHRLDQEIFNNKSVVEDFLMKSVKLDAFMEDVVLRRKDVQLPLGKACLATQPATVTRKNKDASGKKIKRSKCTDTEHTTKSQKINIDPQENVSPVRETQSGQAGSENAVNMNKKHSIANVNTVDKNYIESHVNNELSRPIKSRHEEQDDLNELEIDPNINDDKEATQNVPVMECDLFNDSYKLLYNSDTILSQNIIIKYDSDTPDIDNEIANENIPTVEATKPNELNYKNNNISSEDLFSAGTISENKVKSYDQLIKSDVEMKTNDTLKNSSQNNILSADIQSNEVKVNEIGIKTDDVEHTNQSPSNEVKHEVVETKIDDGIHVKNELTSKVSENKTDPQLSGIEFKMKQMEELAMKKFKGSFLDNMF